MPVLKLPSLKAGGSRASCELEHNTTEIFVFVFVFVFGKSRTSCEMEHDSAKIGESRILKKIGRQ